MEEIKVEKVPESLKNPSVLCVFKVIFQNSDTIKEYRRVKESEELEGCDCILEFKKSWSQKLNWFNGESYVDLLNPEVTKEFLRVTLDPYISTFKEDFGEFVPGVFTDEPNYNQVIPWTREMVEYFHNLNGYNILDMIPLLYFEGENSRKVRYDFWKTVTQRFIDAFTKPYAS